MKHKLPHTVHSTSNLFIYLLLYFITLRSIDLHQVISSMKNKLFQPKDASAHNFLYNPNPYLSLSRLSPSCDYGTKAITLETGSPAINNTSLHGVPHHSLSFAIVLDRRSRRNMNTGESTAVGRNMTADWRSSCLGNLLLICLCWWIKITSHRSYKNVWAPGCMSGPLISP